MSEEGEVRFSDAEEVVRLLRDVKKLSEQNRDKLDGVIRKVENELGVFLEKAQEEVMKIKQEFSLISEKSKALIEKTEQDIAGKAELLDKEGQRIVKEASEALKKSNKRILDEMWADAEKDFLETIEDFQEEIKKAVTKKECRGKMDLMEKALKGTAEKPKSGRISTGEASYEDGPVF